MTLPTPSIEYFLLCPMLIVFGVAVAGVLVEAFVPRRLRYGAQVTLTFGGLVAAFVAVLLVADTISAGRPAVLGAVADRPNGAVPAGHRAVGRDAGGHLHGRTHERRNRRRKGRSAKVAVTVGGDWIPLPRRLPRFPAATPSAKRNGPEPPRPSSSRW